jgi:uncharacterized protein (TIGR02246 family)
MSAQKPEECDTLFERYVNEGNLEALLDLYEADAMLVPGPGQAAVGTEAIRSAMKPFLDAGLQVKVTSSRLWSPGTSPPTTTTGRVPPRARAEKRRNLPAKRSRSATASRMAPGSSRSMIPGPAANSTVVRLR